MSTVRGKMEILITLVFLLYTPNVLSDRDSIINFTNAAVNGTFTCQELQKWVSTEKHYSNTRKNSLFSLMEGCEKQPVVTVDHVMYTPANEKYFSLSKEKCPNHAKVAVIFLSNFSINHNFSHFLHALLRLFCALIDSRLLVWDSETLTFRKTTDYVIWLDENVQTSKTKDEWFALMGDVRYLKGGKKSECYTADKVVYGSGCVRLLPPEKWYGYPGCRANKVLPAFSYFIKSQLDINSALTTVKIDSKRRSRAVSGGKVSSGSGVNIAFAVRKVGDLTGRREISNLQEVYDSLQRSSRLSNSFLYNISFEDMDTKDVVRHMASLHVFVSVHGAGMTNTFFMQPGAAVVEILPYPLCQCRSPDYFYGIAGYYQGSSLALGLRHYVYCVPPHQTSWQTKPKDITPASKCNWRHLHAVRDVTLDAAQFSGLMRSVERDLVASGVIELASPVINLNPNANG